MNDATHLNRLKDEIKTLLAEELEADVEDMDLTQDPLDYGLDSIMVTSFIISLNEKFSINIEPMSVFEHDSLDDMVESLFAEYQQNIVAVYEQEPEKEQE